MMVRREGKRVERREVKVGRSNNSMVEIVTGHLLEVLAARSDLDAKIAQTLRAGLTRTTQSAGRVYARQQNPTAPKETSNAISEAETLHRAGGLDDYAVLDALRTNRLIAAKAMLTVMAGVPASAVDRACTLRSARAIVSLGWQAGLSAQTAVVLQTMLASVAPDQVLRPTPNNAFPLSEDEMRWQLASSAMVRSVVTPACGTGSRGAFRC